MKSRDITATNGRVINAFNPIIQSAIEPTIKDKIKTEIDKSKIQIGTLNKFYPYLDKAEVKVNGKLILCKILHRMHGSLIDFFTPEGELGFCETLKEPCIIPRGELDCLVVNINDNTNEQLLLGYFLKDDVVYISPAEAGHYKINNIGATKEYGLDIGCGDINLDSSNGVTFKEGIVQDDESIREYASSENVYTKKEVDNIVKKAIDDLRQEILGG